MRNSENRVIREQVVLKFVFYTRKLLMDFAVGENQM